MSQNYDDAQRDLQDRFDTRRLADRLAESTRDFIIDPHKTFIERREMFFLATTSADGWPQCSYKGGEPGFVRVLDTRTLVFPLYDGNGMYLSSGNIKANPRVAMLFVNFEDGSRLRLNGEAHIADDEALVASYPGAQMVVRVTVRDVFANCRRYVPRHVSVERSPFIPDANGAQPVPDWKLDPWFAGTLPADDPAHDPDRPVAPASPKF